MSKEIAKQDESKSQIANALDYQQASLGAEVAMKALKLVQPMIASVSNELEESLGNNETTIVIRRSSNSKSATILMLDNTCDYTLCGAGANKTTANRARDMFIKQQRDIGNISDEQWEIMNSCDNTPVFRGEMNPDTKRPRAIKQFYVIRDFVDALLTGRMQDITQKLIK